MPTADDLENQLRALPLEKGVTPQVAATLRGIYDQLTGLRIAEEQHARNLAEIRPPIVLSSRLVQIPANGQMSISVHVAARGAAITSLSASPITVTAGPGGASTPGPGPGVHTIGSYGETVMPIGDNGLTLWGAPGALANVDLLSRTPLPRGGGAPQLQVVQFTTSGPGLGALAQPVTNGAIWGISVSASGGLTLQANGVPFWWIITSDAESGATYNVGVPFTGALSIVGTVAASGSILWSPS